MNGNGLYEINHLWVVPEHMGKNVGKVILQQLEGRIGQKKTIKVVADPNAMAFYQNFGYQKVGEVDSRPDGRKLPLLKKILSN